MKKKKKRSLAARFVGLVLSIVLGFCAVAAVGLVIYDKFLDGDDESFVAPPILDTVTNAIAGGPGSFNLAVFGVDGDESRTDVIFIVHYDEKNKQVNLLSVPRDTHVYVCEEAREIMDEVGRWYPTECKINEVHSYAGKENGPACSIAQLEDLLGISIDHYVKVNLEGFKKIVDAIGGVEVDVPQDMYYKDPIQDLYIDLKQGPQTLDGAQAEQLVRFRSYPNGDVDRVQVQQLFLKAFCAKILNTKTILTNLPTLIKSMYEYMTTDMGLTDLVKYAKAANSLSLDKIHMETLPGVGQYIGKVSYYIHDEEATKKVVRQVFYGEELTGSKALTIEVANGGNISGLAAKKQEMLQEAGFFVDSISTFNGEQTGHTRIVVAEDGVGEDLLEYFPDAVIVIDPEELPRGVDIKIILGLDETE